MFLSFLPQIQVTVTWPQRTQAELAAIAASRWYALYPETADDANCAVCTDSATPDSDPTEGLVLSYAERSPEFLRLMDTVYECDRRLDDEAVRHMEDMCPCHPSLDYTHSPYFSRIQECDMALWGLEQFGTTERFSH